MVELDLDAFDYELPAELLSAEPATPRDSAKLFVYDTKTDEVRLDTFAHVGNYVPPDAFLVFNTTKVEPARVTLAKETGGKVELLLLVNEWREGDATVPGLSDRKLEIGRKLAFPDGNILTVAGQKENVFYFAPNMPRLELFVLIERYGTTPIPKYLGKTSLPEAALRERYQSVFAKTGASVAAPTASLHFTDGVLADLGRRGIPQAEVTLDVGLGTFAPLRPEHFAEKRLHEEYYEVSPEEAAKMNAWKRAGKKLFAVGTTACRTIESASREGGEIVPGKGKTDIFIFPPYEFKAVDGLITNFHIPKSSLMLLVESFLRDKGAKRSLLELYKIAIENKFRFYSFGDAMLIL